MCDCYIRQYCHPHYKNTRSSLKIIASRVERELGEYYLKRTKKITALSLYDHLDEGKKKKLFSFLGINFTNLIK